MGTSYLRAGDPVDDLPSSRSGGYAATANREEIERLILALENDVRQGPTADRYTELGQLYLDRARTTGDVGDDAKAEAAATRAVDLAPADPDARSLLASARYANHDFPGALSLARAVVADDASQLGALATVGDAQLELGAYDEASAVFAALAVAKPDAPATVIRLARLAYIQGKPEEARRLAAQADELARATALGGASLTTYVAYHAQIELDTGHYRESARLFTAALEETPGSFVALAGLGRARAAQGRRGEAISLLAQAVAVLPDPATLATLSDLYQLDGKPDRATAASGTMEATGTLSQVNRQLYSRVLSNYYADHDVHTDEALRLSEADQEVRKDVFGYDTYAWALYKNGRLADARAASDAATRVHTRDARLLYHSGMIARAQGDVERARAELSEALAVSPQFDPLQAPRARDALARLTARS